MHDFWFQMVNAVISLQNGLLDQASLAFGCQANGILFRGKTQDFIFGPQSVQVGATENEGPFVKMKALNIASR